MYLLLKFAYLGEKFEGFQRQDDRITVEGEILRVLKKYSISKSLKSASRTDRGVSSLGNVIKIETDKDIKTVFGILNSQLQNIYFHSYAIVSKEFNPRMAAERFYRYYFVDAGYDMEKMRDCSALFVGTHDFSGFSKQDSRSSIRTIKSIEIRRNGKVLVLDIVGESFLWNMVRRIVAAIQQVGLGKLEINELKDSIVGKTSSRFIVKASNLVLVDVKYPVKFKKVPSKKAHIEDYEKAVSTYQFYKQLLKIEGR